MGRLPKKAMARWTKLKSELLPAIDKINDPAFDDDAKKELKKKVKSLYDQFNSGLSKSLKKADAAKSDNDALKPLSEAIKTANTYHSKVKTAHRAWGINGGPVCEKMDAALTDIERACEGETVRIAKATK